MTDAPPACLTAGDTWTWTAPAAYASHPPPDWSVRFVIVPEAGGVPLAAIALDVAGTYKVSIPKAETAPLVPGRYAYTLIAEGDASGLRETLGRGAFTVAPDPVTFTGDTRSAAARILAAIEATIEGRASADADSYTIEGRSLARTPVADLLRLREVYRAEVRAERGNSAPFRLRRVCH